MIDFSLLPGNETIITYWDTDAYLITLDSDNSLTDLLISCVSDSTVEKRGLYGHLFETVYDSDIGDCYRYLCKIFYGRTFTRVNLSDSFPVFLVLKPLPYLGFSRIDFKLT